MSPTDTHTSPPEGEQAKRSPGRPFDSESAKKAAEASARVRRERRERDSGRTPEQAADATDEAKIIAALQRKAEAGDVPAARELREWLARYQAERPTTILELLTKEQRDTVRAWLDGKQPANQTIAS